MALFPPHAGPSFLQLEMRIRERLAQELCLHHTSCASGTQPATPSCGITRSQVFIAPGRLGTCLSCKLCMFIPWGLSKPRHEETNRLFLSSMASRGKADQSSSIFLLQDGTFQNMSLASPQVTQASVCSSKWRGLFLSLFQPSVVLSSPAQSGFSPADSSSRRQHPLSNHLFVSS